VIATVSPASDFVSTGFLAKAYGCSIQTVINTVTREAWIETTTTLGGHRRISHRDYRVYLGLEEEQEETAEGKRVLIVTRTSTAAQKSSLKQQETDCRKWISKNLSGPLQIDVNSRIASGLLLDHPSFISIIDGILARQWDVIVCRTSERMCRSALCLVRKLCERSNIELVIVNDENKSWCEQLADDIIAYAGSAHAKFNGMKTQKLYQINVSEDVLKKLYELKKLGMTYLDLERWCEENNVRGTNGKSDEPVALQDAVIARILKRNLKALQVTDSGPTANSVDMFLKKHVRNNPVGKVTMKDFQERYAEFCKIEDLPKMGLHQMTAHLKTLGWYDDGCCKQDGTTRRRVFLGKDLK